MNKSNLILSLVAIFSFISCEYDPSGNNFVELTPPDDTIPIEISLNNVNPSDTIYVYQDTKFSIKINSPKDFRQAVILLDGQECNYMWNNSLDFIIRPEQISEDVHKLTVNAIFASGTGSLAEMMGLEGYMGELSWNIRVIHNPQNHFEVGYRINEDGFLEIYWKNAVPENIIEKYTIHSGLTQNTDITINDATQKSFIDYGYVCGYAVYEVRTYLKDGYSFLQRLSLDTPTPAIYFEDLGLDNLRVYWDRPFANGRFTLLDVAPYVVIAETNDTTITIPQLFGRNRQFSLEIRPQKAEYDNYHNKFSAWDWFCQGISLGLPNWPLYAYNKIDNIIYTSKDGLVAFDATTLQEINTVSIMGNPWGFAYGGKIASAPHNSTVAAMTGEETWIFADSRFINPIKISPLPGNVNTRLSALTSDDRFFVVQGGGSNICKIFNALTGEKIVEFSFTYPTIYDIPDHVTVSEDGHFFCASSGNGIEVFEIDGTTTNLLYTDTRQYKGASFVPSQPDKLLLRVGSYIEIRQIPSFNLIQALDVSANGATFCNIDPASMSLLYHQNDSLKVCKISNLTETIFKIRSDETTCKMFNNKLLTYGKGGISFDITPYLNQ
jgi:hypothetical protein